MSRLLENLALVALLAAPVAAQTCPPAVLPLTIQGTHNPYLAGQPNGTQAKTDTAPSESPFLVPLAVHAGQELMFSNTMGDVSNGAGGGGPGPEGDLGWMLGATPELGISGYIMPANALLGVFLDDSTNPGPAPLDTDFSTPALRDFAKLQPKRFQVFYIGNGLREDGVTPQTFVVPNKATRLFLGSCDGYGWNNNSGSFTLDVEHPLPMIACPSVVSVSAGGAQTWELDAGPEHAGMSYLVLGSVTGTSPGFPLDSVELPLVVDSYTLYMLFAANQPPYNQSVGLLDTQGRATASFNVPAGLQTTLVGQQFYHAYVVLELTPTLLEAVFTSNPTAIGLVP